MGGRNGSSLTRTRPPIYHLSYKIVGDPANLEQRGSDGVLDDTAFGLRDSLSLALSGRR
jgi:hypothetical protein